MGLYLQGLEARIEACEDLAAKERYNVIKVTAEVKIYKGIDFRDFRDFREFVEFFVS